MWVESDVLVGGARCISGRS